jgi:hypothetical protein
MNIDFSQMNFLAILIAIIINQAFGALWYSPVLVGKAWASLVGIKMEEIDKKAAMRSFITAIILAVVTYFIIAFVLMISNNQSWTSGALTGFILSLLITAQMGTNYAYEGRSIKLLLINAFYPIICYTIGGAIIGLF